MKLFFTVRIIVNNAYLCSYLVVKRRPSGPGVVFMSRREEGVVADDTVVQTMFVVVVTRRKPPRNKNSYNSASFICLRNACYTRTYGVT